MSGVSGESQTESAGAETRLRPLRVGEILDAAIKLYTRNWRAVWSMVAVVVIPVAIIQQVVIGSSLPSLAFVRNGTLYTPTGTLGTPAGGLIVTEVLSILSALVINGAMALNLVDSYIGRPLKWSASLREAGSRLGGLLALAILYGVLVIIGFIAIILPGIFLVVAWSVAIPALMFEHVGGFKALRRSFRLVRKRWWATFGVLLAAFVMLVIADVLIGLVFRAIEKGAGASSIGVWLFFNGLIRVVVSLIAIPFITAVTSVLYVDLRVRKEGLDLELLTERSGPSIDSDDAFPGAPHSADA